MCLVVSGWLCLVVFPWCFGALAAARTAGVRLKTTHPRTHG